MSNLEEMNSAIDAFVVEQQRNQMIGQFNLFVSVLLLGDYAHKQENPTNFIEDVFKEWRKNSSTDPALLDTFEVTFKPILQSASLFKAESVK